MPEEECLSYIYQIARCLEDLKSQDRVKCHGNLKLSNVFIDNERHVVAIGDFFIKHVTSKVHEDEKLFKMMINHLPPEFFTLGSDRDENFDVWAIGVMLYQLSTNGELPFNIETDEEEFDEYETKRGIINIQYDKLLDRKNTQLLLDEIFTLKPHNRITTGEILKFLHSRIDMKKMNTAMKRASENLYNSDEESGDDIKKKLNYLRSSDVSDNGIMQRSSANTGLDYKKTDRNFGDNIHVSESRDEEDFNHLDNLVKGHVSNPNTNPNDFLNNLPSSYEDSSKGDDSDAESSKVGRSKVVESNSDNSEESKDDSESLHSAGRLSPQKKRNVNLIKAKEDVRIDTNMASLAKI